MFCGKKACLAALLCLAVLLSGCLWSSQPQAFDENEENCDAIYEAWNAKKGMPYVWGGDSYEDGGFDCSGAIYAVQKSIGRPVPRTTSKRYFLTLDSTEKHWTDAQCGDWIWWTLTPDRPYGHIGMHTRQPEVWQSGSSTGPTSISMVKGNYWDDVFEASKTP